MPALRRASRTAMRRSISGRKWRIRPWIGQAAASPSAQIVWPSTCLVTSMQQVDLGGLGVALRPCAPSRATSSRCLRGTACTGRSFRACRNRPRPRDRLDDVGRLVHHDHRRGAEARLHVASASRNPSAPCRRSISGSAAPTRRPGSPPADCPSRRARRRHACRSARAAECPSPLRHCRACSRGRRCRTPWCRCCWDGRCRRTTPRRGAGWSGATAMRFDVVDRGRAAIEADIGRERRLQPRQALLAFEAFEQRGFFAADIGAGAVMDDRDRNPSRGCCSCRSAWRRRPRRSRAAALRARG